MQSARISWRDIWVIGDSTKHIFKLFNIKTIIAVFDATFAVEKRKPENIQVCTRIRTLELKDNGAALYQRIPTKL